MGPITVIALAVLVEPVPIVVAKGLSSQRRWPTAALSLPGSCMYIPIAPAEVIVG